MKKTMKRGIRKIVLMKETVGSEDTKPTTTPSTANGYCYTYQVGCTTDGNGSGCKINDV